MIQPLQSRYFQNLATTVGSQATILAVGVFTGIAAARLLGPQGRGALAAAVLWPLVLVLFASLGLNQAIVFHAGKQRFTLAEVWTAALVLWLAQSIIVLVAGRPVVALALRHYSPEVRHVSFLFLAFAPLIMLGGYPANLLQGRLDLLSFNLLRAITPCVYAAGLIILMLRGRCSLREVVALQIIGACLTVGVGLWLAFCRARQQAGRFLAWNRSACASLLKFGCKSNLSSVTSYVNQRSDQLLLSLFVGPHDLGLYVVAVALATAVSFFPQAAGVVTLATGSNLAPEEARRVIARSFRLTLAALGAGCGLLLVLCPWLINFAYGPSFGPAVTACKILLPGSVALGLNQVLYDGARALDQPLLPSYSEGISTAVTFGALLLFLPRFGFLGAAVASTLAYSTGLAVTLHLARTRLRIGLRDLLGSPLALPALSQTAP
ncbi:MAG TPA: oligosaccharide flippase family protein [Terriglobia bacterium]|nr:oligosaccharide flippase family protein [Terriglobia bacterium]